MAVSTLAEAQTFPTRNYDFSCNGSTSSGPVGEVGIIQFSTSTAAVGSAELNLNNGSIIRFTSFTATFVNGTANAQGVGGNSIPKACFTASAIFSGDSFGINSKFFGCYNEAAHSFDWVQTVSSGGTLTCHGIEM